MLRKHLSRAASIALVAGMYLVALGLGILTFFLAKRAMSEIWALLLADLFLFVSIPMMERRQLAHKPEYAAYRKRTRLFI